MLNDVLADMLSVINNAELRGRKQCVLRPSSRLALKVLEILNAKRFIGAYKLIEDGRGGTIEVNLLGSINKCGAVKPRFSVKNANYEVFEKRFLPAKDFGVLIISTSSGVMSHSEAKSRGLGGKLLAYCY